MSSGAVSGLPGEESHLHLVGARPLPEDPQGVDPPTSDIEQLRALFLQQAAQIADLQQKVDVLEHRAQSTEMHTLCLDHLVMFRISTVAVSVWSHATFVDQFGSSYLCFDFTGKAGFDKLAAAVSATQPGVTAESLRSTAGSVLTRHHNTKHPPTWADLDALVAWCLPLLSAGVAAMMPGETWTLQHYDVIKTAFRGT